MRAELANQNHCAVLFLTASTCTGTIIRSNLAPHFSLSHVVDPLKEERVQQDQSLTVWIIEAKHLPKKRYKQFKFVLLIFSMYIACTSMLYHIVYRDSC